MSWKLLCTCLFTLSFCCTLAVCAHGAGRSPADESEQPPPMIGPIGGINFASMSVDPDVGLEQQMRMRPTAGVALLLPLGNLKNQLQFELAYIGKGVENIFTDTTETHALDYLCFSPMLHLNVGKQPGFFLRVGPEVALLLKSRLTVEDTSGRRSYDAKKFYSDLELGLKGGAGINIRVMSRLYFQMNVIYSIGLVDILTGPGTGNNVYVTRGLQIHTGLLVPLRIR